MITFGPIPSRRLGRSLGVNNIPPKVCSYSCLYCQAGTTDTLSTLRKSFYPPDMIYDEVGRKLDMLHEAGERIDYITFVPDGEPTLDANLGATIRKLKPFGIRLAVITNATLLPDEGVRRELSGVNWICVKVDSVNEETWRKINRPHGKLSLEKIMRGVNDFASEFEGTLMTETMLVRDVNDDPDSLTATAEFIGGLKPRKAYVMIPTRPPAEESALPPLPENLDAAYRIFSSCVETVELLARSEGTEFTFSNSAEEELLSILAVHPMTKEAVEEFVDKAQIGWEFVERLITGGILKLVEYSEKEYLIRDAKRMSKDKTERGGLLTD